MATTLALQPNPGVRFSGILSVYHVQPIAILSSTVRTDMSTTTAPGGPAEIIHAVGFKCCARLQPLRSTFGHELMDVRLTLSLDPHQLPSRRDRAALYLL